MIETMAVLVDDSEVLSVAEAAKAGGWRAISTPRYSAGYGSGALWFRLRVSGARDGIAILSVRPSYLDTVTFYLPRAMAIRPGEAGEDGLSVYRQGDRLPLSSRIYAVRGFGVPVDLQAGVSREIYVRLETTSTRLFVVDLVWADMFIAAVAQESLLGGASYMLILAMLAFAGRQWLRGREPIYAAHIGLALAVGLFFLSRSGDMSLLLAQAEMVADRMVGISVCLALGGLVLFVAQTLPASGGLAFGTVQASLLMIAVGGSTLLAALGLYEVVAGPFAILIMVAIVYLLVLSLLAREGDLLLRCGRVLALALFLPTGLVNLGLIDLYWQAEISLSLGTMGLLVVLVAIAWRADSQRRSAYALALADAETARIEARLKEKSMALHKQWVSIFSHEIKTPLSIINSSRSNIARIEASPEVIERTDKIGRAVGAIDGLVDAMLAAEELEARIGTAEDQTFALCGLIDSCVTQVGASRISVICPPDLMLHADPALVRIAISNLLVNAAVHGPAEGPIRIAAEADGPRGAKVTVSNDGPELASDVVTRLFEKHFRTPGSPGHGIGLWAVSAIALRYGGRAAYSHEATSGNVFSLWFMGARS